MKKGKGSEGRGHDVMAPESSLEKGARGRKSQQIKGEPGGKREDIKGKKKQRDHHEWDRIKSESLRLKRNRAWERSVFRWRRRGRVGGKGGYKKFWTVKRDQLNATVGHDPSKGKESCWGAKLGKRNQTKLKGKTTCEKKISDTVTVFQKQLFQGA